MLLKASSVEDCGSQPVAPPTGSRAFRHGAKWKKVMYDLKMAISILALISVSLSFSVSVTLLYFPLPWYIAFVMGQWTMNQNLQNSEPPQNHLRLLPQVF